MVVTHTFYFMLCQSSLLSTVISIVYKDKRWFDKSMSVIFCMENIWKRILLFPLHVELNLKTLLCNWGGSQGRPGRMKSIILKGNNTIENPIPRQEISNQSTMWSTKVRSGHNICCLCSSLLELSSCRVTYENCYKSSVFFNQVWDEWMDLRNSNDFELRNFYFTQTYRSLFRKFSSEVEKCTWSSCEAQFRYFQIK